MITVFNRRLLTTLFDQKQQGQLRSLLLQNQIEYLVKVINRKSPSVTISNSRARTGTFAENLSYEYQYNIYVKKSDYDKALACIRNN
jgi:hypothetical protein